MSSNFLRIINFSNKQMIGHLSENIQVECFREKGKLKVKSLIFLLQKEKQGDKKDLLRIGISSSAEHTPITKSIVGFHRKPFR